jgi:hypothetical protein
MDMGWISKEKQINNPLVENIISLDQSAFVVTGATVIHVGVNKDFMQIHDSTCSWWIEMTVLGTPDRRFFGYESRVKFKKGLSDRVFENLIMSFMVSGAELQGLTSETLFLCPLDLVKNWPDKILVQKKDWDFFPVYEHPNSHSEEKFIMGRIKKIFSRLKIQSGPGFDPANWTNMGYLAIKTTGLFPQKVFLDNISKKIIDSGGKRLELSQEHFRPSSFVGSSGFRVGKNSGGPFPKRGDANSQT